MSDNSKTVDAFSLEAGVPKIEGDIRPKPKYADRISKRVILVAMALLVLMIGIFFLALDSMDQKNKKENGVSQREKQPESKKFTETNVPKELIGGLDSDSVNGTGGGTSLLTSKAPDDPLGGSTAAGASLSNPASAAAGQIVGVPAMGSGRGGALPSNNDLGAGYATADAATRTPPPLTPEQQAANMAKQARLQRMAQAKANGLGAKPFTAGDSKGVSNVTTAATEAALAALNHLSTTPEGTAGGGMTQTSMQMQQGGRDDAEQDEKRRFLQGSGKLDNHYLPYTQQPNVSQAVLKRGSYLPLRLEGSINSGQPGMVRARVIEDVYDTVTGCRLLVPAMTIVQGEYDSKVAVGQTRNLVVWNYMGFEDGSDLTLGRMQGYDSSGAAGIEADVDNHYMRLFGAAFGLSMVTAGVQMSVPPTPTGTTAQTPQQSIANALTQQYGQLGAQLLGKYLQVQPTLRNYAGERFMVMLPLNIVFKKVWRDRCGGA